ncbi:MAG: ankyrin repeat domain-containing protein [Planctomycetota bacterium]
MKRVTTAILIVTVFAVGGCPKQESSDNEQRPPRKSLHAAALQGDIDAIRQHIDAGSELNKKDVYGSSPLIVAVTFGKTEAARVLIKAGADLEITNNEGAAPLHIAAFFCRAEIVKALLENGADKNALNKAGRTALETVSSPFENVIGIYDGIGKSLRPLGLKLDYERIKKTRPEIAEILR